MWLLQSRKAQVALGSIFTIILSRLLPKWGFTTEDVNVISTAIAAVASIWIHGIAKEDAAAKAGPATQTNVNSDVRNVPAPLPVDEPHVTSPAPPPAKPTQMVVSLNPASLEAVVNAVVKKLQVFTPPTPPPIDMPKGN